MVTEEGQDGQSQEKVVLKRKLTGPPRLLLGKSKTQGRDRSEARTKRKNKRLTLNNGTPIGSSLKDPNTEAGENKGSPIITSDKLITSSRSEEEASPEMFTDPPRCGSTPEDTSKGQLDRNGQIKKSAKRGWKRIFSPAVICTRRQRRESGTTSVEECDHRIPLSKETEERSLEVDVVSLNDKRIQDTSDDIIKRKGRFNIRTWTTIKRFLTPSSQVQQRSKSQGRVVRNGSEKIRDPPVTFRKKLQHFLIHGRRTPSPAVALVQEDIQEPPGDHEAEIQPTSTQDEGRVQGPSMAQLDDLLEDGKEVRGQCTERVTVSAEVSALLSGERDEEELVTNPMGPESIIITTTDESLAIDIEDPEDSQIDVTKVEVTIGTETLETERSVKTKDELTCATNTDSTVLDEVLDVAMDTDKVLTDQQHKIQCLEKDEAIETIDGVIFNDVKTVVKDTNEHLCNSNQILSFEDASGKANDTSEKENYLISRNTEVNILQTLTNTGLDNGLSVLQCTFCETNSTPVVDSNGPGQDGHILEDEGFESGLPVEDNQNSVCRESRLVQTARSLVQAAMRAAVEQLSMEHQGDITNVHREAQGCRDHA